MLQSLSSGDSLAGVKLNHGHGKVQLILGESIEKLRSVLLSELREGGLEVGQFADSWPSLVSWRAVKLENLKDLIDLRIAHEEWSFLDELGEDATDGPHVDAKGVLSLSQQDFWGSVPQSLNLMCEGFDGDGEGSCEAEIANFDIAFLVNEQILWLQIPVDDSFGMTVVNA